MDIEQDAVEFIISKGLEDEFMLFIASKSEKVNKE